MGHLHSTVSMGLRRYFGSHSIISEGDVYMTRYWIGRLRLHIFHRGDLDPDCHDHPWDFWTFPLTSYVEAVLFTPNGAGTNGIPMYAERLKVVHAWQLYFRPSTHRHRVLGSFDGWAKDFPPGSFEDDPGRWVLEPHIGKRKVVTIVWRGPVKRNWGFMKERKGVWCWQAWKDYILAGGKDAPCNDSE